jgi:predicted nucleotidyltransferase
MDTGRPQTISPDDAEAAHLVTAAVPDTIALYRFGSTVTGATHAESDIDLAILAAHPLDPVFRFDLQEELAVRLRRPVDLVDLRRASTVMRVQVIARGTVLAVFDRPAMERFEAYAYSAYARLNEERAPVLERVRRERTIYG